MLGRIRSPKPRASNPPPLAIRSPLEAPLRVLSLARGFPVGAERFIRSTALVPLKSAEGGGGQASTLFQSLPPCSSDSAAHLTVPPQLCLQGVQMACPQVGTVSGSKGIKCHLAAFRVSWDDKRGRASGSDIHVPALSTQPEHVEFMRVMTATALLHPSRTGTVASPHLDSVPTGPGHPITCSSAPPLPLGLSAPLHISMRGLMLPPRF